MNKIHLALDKFWDWLLVSSANPEAVALTVKGFLATGVSTLMMAIGVVHIQIPNLDGTLNQIIDTIVLVIQDGLGLIGVISMLYGLIRKLVILLKTWYSAL